MDNINTFSIDRCSSTQAATVHLASMSQMVFCLSNLVVAGSFTKAVPFADEPLAVVLECVNGTGRKNLQVPPACLAFWGVWVDFEWAPESNCTCKMKVNNDGCAVVESTGAG